MSTNTEDWAKIENVEPSVQSTNKRQKYLPQVTNVLIPTTLRTQAFREKAAAEIPAAGDERLDSRSFTERSCLSSNPGPSSMDEYRISCFGSANLEDV
jgi:hypothetical protein